jgi:hypothetical protein
LLGVSISADNETARLGFGEEQVNATTRRISDAVLGMGGGLVFGHDWRPGGVMEQVLNIAMDRRGVGDEKHPVLHNFVPWPDHPALSEDQRKRLRGHLQIWEAGLPVPLRQKADPQPPASSAEGLYLRARALTHLREQLTATATARLCMGGRQAGSSGLYPGILEEALLALQAKQPLYVTALFGGATARLVEAIELPDRTPSPAGFAPTRDDVAVAVKELRKSWEPDHPEVEPNPDAIWQAFNKTSVVDLARGNGLSEGENRALFHAQSIQEALHLVLRGLVRLQVNP